MVFILKRISCALTRLGLYIEFLHKSFTSSHYGAFFEQAFIGMLEARNPENVDKIVSFLSAMSDTYRKKGYANITQLYTS